MSYVSHIQFNFSDLAQVVIANDTMYIGHRTWKNEVDKDKEVSSPLARSHDLGSFYVVSCRNKIFISLTQL